MNKGCMMTTGEEIKVYKTVVKHLTCFTKQVQVTNQNPHTPNNKQMSWTPFWLFLALGICSRRKHNFFLFPISFAGLDFPKLSCKSVCSTYVPIRLLGYLTDFCNKKSGFIQQNIFRSLKSHQVLDDPCPKSAVWGILFWCNSYYWLNCLPLIAYYTRQKPTQVLHHNQIVQWHQSLIGLFTTMFIKS